MTGWLLTTSTSVCTFAYIMPGYGGFLVVDSASLAGGEYGSGTFRLNPAGDTIRMVPDPDHPDYDDEIKFPVLPAGDGRAPTPPDHGSASLTAMYGGWTPIYNWYIDSTPTPGQRNDDYSAITGIVRWGSGHRFDWVDISVFGPMGSSFSNVSASGEAFDASGLGAGRYQVAACGWYASGESLFYPESVDVGYSETLSGIILDFDAQGLQESREPSACKSRPAATVIRGLPAGSVVFDASGRRVVNPKSGIYFVRAASRELSAVGCQKVIIQR
ncbi:MAG: hypothetical protein NTX53_04095 [candidate division WOR-3 bacterium]|nr:hypothetical protein [candidate division WOR-3 bacterium]